MSREEVERFMAQRMQNPDVQYAHGLQQQLFTAQQRIAELEAALRAALPWIISTPSGRKIASGIRAALEHKEGK